jgi:hypothetical protein
VQLIFARSTRPGRYRHSPPYLPEELITSIGLICFRADYLLVGVFLAFVLIVMWTALFARFWDIK